MAFRSGRPEKKLFGLRRILARDARREGIAFGGLIHRRANAIGHQRRARRVRCMLCQVAEFHGGHDTHVPSGRRRTQGSTQCVENTSNDTPDPNRSEKSMWSRASCHSAEVIVSPTKAPRASIGWRDSQLASTCPLAWTRQGESVPRLQSSPPTRRCSFSYAARVTARGRCERNVRKHSSNTCRPNAVVDQRPAAGRPVAAAC